ncbi:metallophosphoesterase [uncultured Agathobaculum sp.]|uniref:metallophosphoesterase n=1 Tax=uncultured Agathobaculum sp. TaxID=2048140 RepID=UPI0026311434|nr:metallophosphoesterase [uncultured Agathobaculum sp.]
MIAIFLAPVYILLNVYLARWVLRWTGACHRLCGAKAFRVVFIVVYALVASAPLTGFLIQSPYALRKFLRQVGNYWFGWMLYLVLAVLIVEVALFVIRRVRGKDFEQMQQVRRVQGGVALALVCAVSFYGMVHAKQLYVTEYDVTLQGAGEDMTVALLADLHLGYSTEPAYIERAVQVVNDMQPDLVVIAGDIFDNEYEAIPQPERIAAALASLDSTYGTYACWGNHDLSEPILAGFTWDIADENKNDPRMAEFLEAADVTLLEDRAVTLENGVQLVGRRDPSRSNKLAEQRLSPEQLVSSLNQEQPIFVIDHQPEELEALAQAGVDLDLSGHTHDGQLFPGNLLMRLLWDNACGCEQIGDMTSVVTSGLGVWGPDMRVGTRSEVVCVSVHFSE